MPRASKNINTFSEYQEEKQARRESLIRAYLIMAQKSRVRFKFVTDLAKFVAIHVTQVEGSNCNTATLLRNPRYKSLLLSYLADEMRPGVKNLVLDPLDSPASKALLTQLQLENRNVVNENARLKAHVAALKDDVPTARFQQHSQNAAISSLQNSESNFVLTCQVLLRLLEYFSDLDLVRIDAESSNLLDKSKKTHNVIADARLTAPFMIWLKANRTS